MGLAALMDEQIERADFNSDGTVDAQDAILIPVMLSGFRLKCSSL